ncbi:hypothetical protein B0I72DRAFT_162763 [Yarrowia lipolytica]|uniref:Histone H4 n=2 Tax=Yarrowia lipolytica TaxID=4952 RepID=Q6CH71_YARLI|nr:YALI0A11781p [Yarrowia lipolytica CLIB122]RDW22862.1 hypothetical protein B0I71DRAFT_169326 [Yarrowia lipolytica]RDW30121.1 hypothetical protein B0I72DRAFT_162763 [Yarrowia lipolytica]RDW43979.1 hypothetical protein B0I74DRAFT_161549 [Yarrowia lipolytica]RDW50708.1 hypothetical protein B0I75DRAFT_167015 [Yarrowia lipolytica]CAG83920.1 YALI0A11781p [Yarrowia lipolytica CLIB122]|eukprot:XP_499991.1 YALI0A11781p [Yarrowia lipolytica CLIB122]
MTHQRDNDADRDNSGNPREEYAEDNSPDSPDSPDQPPSQRRSERGRQTETIPIIVRQEENWGPDFWRDPPGTHLMRDTLKNRAMFYSLARQGFYPPMCRYERRKMQHLVRPPTRGLPYSKERLAALNEALRKLEDPNAVFDPDFEADLIAEYEGDLQAQREAVIRAEQSARRRARLEVRREAQQAELAARRARQEAHRQSSLGDAAPRSAYFDQSALDAMSRVAAGSSAEAEESADERPESSGRPRKRRKIAIDDEDSDERPHTWSGTGWDDHQKIAPDLQESGGFPDQDGDDVFLDASDEFDDSPVSAPVVSPRDFENLYEDDSSDEPIASSSRDVPRPSAPFNQTTHVGSDVSQSPRRSVPNYQPRPVFVKESAPDPDGPSDSSSGEESDDNNKPNRDKGKAPASSSDDISASESDPSYSPPSKAPATTLEQQKVASLDRSGLAEESVPNPDGPSSSRSGEENRTHDTENNGSVVPNSSIPQVHDADERSNAASQPEQPTPYLPGSDVADDPRGSEASLVRGTPTDQNTANNASIRLTRELESLTQQPTKPKPNTGNNTRRQGTGGKGLGKGGAKRHRKVIKDVIQGVTKPSLRRIARRGGVKRISTQIYEEGRTMLKIFLENLIKDAVAYTEHAKRKTVTSLDVVYAAKRRGRPIYGYGWSR